MEIAENKIPAEVEELSIKDKFNEYILTTLRTKWGIDIDFVSAEFGEQMTIELLEKLTVQIEEKMILKKGSVFTLSERGKYFADRVSSFLFL